MLKASQKATLELHPLTEVEGRQSLSAAGRGVGELGRLTLHMCSVNAWQARATRGWKLHLAPFPPLDGAALAQHFRVSTSWSSDWD